MGLAAGTVRTAVQLPGFWTAGFPHHELEERDSGHTPNETRAGRRARGRGAGSGRSGGAVGPGFPGLVADQVGRQHQPLHGSVVQDLLQPGHARERGQVGERRRDDADRGHALDAVSTRSTTSPRPTAMPFNFHVLLWGNQQPAWMANLPADEQLLRDQEVVPGRGDALPEHRVISRSSTRAPGIRRTARRPRTRARTSTPAATTSRRSGTTTTPTARATTGSSTPSGWPSSTSPTPS